MEYGNHDVRSECGESYSDIVARSMPFTGRLEGIYGDTDAKVPLISHRITLAMMLPHLLSNVDWAFSGTHAFDGTFYAVGELRDGE
jgi:broad specificity phosphatase PhoE